MDARGVFRQRGCVGRARRGSSLREGDYQVCAEGVQSAALTSMRACDLPGGIGVDESGCGRAERVEERGVRVNICIAFASIGDAGRSW